MAEKKRLIVKNLSCYFGEIPALLGINFDLEPGEILGIVGQRGAGKTTLFQLLSGVYGPSVGGIYFSGKRVHLSSPSAAQHLGIEVVYQEPLIDDNLDVLQNVFLGRELFAIKTLEIWPQKKIMREIVGNILIKLGESAKIIDEPVSNLKNDQRQIVAFARALCRPCKLLMIDNSIATLNFECQQLLLNYLKELAEQKCSIIISSDDIKQIFTITDRILVLYQGRQVGIRKTSETAPREIVELIVGTNRREQVTPVIWAFENYYAAQQQAEELRRSQKELRQNLKEQDSLNRKLVERLSEQVSALDRLNLALQEANRRSMNEREAERKNIALDLHDQVIQDLISFNYQLEILENMVQEVDHRQEIDKIRAGLRQVVVTLRQLCSDLRPPALDSQGLSGAIQSLIHQWSTKNSIKISQEIDPRLGRLPELIELTVYRIIQEGLINIRKHANASYIRLIIQRTPTASIVVRLLDNGRGIPKPINLVELSDEKHFGLVGIGERVSLLGGTMEVNSSPQGGFELNIEIPSPWPSITGN